MRQIRNGPQLAEAEPTTEQENWDKKIIESAFSSYEYSEVQAHYFLSPFLG